MDIRANEFPTNSPFIYNSMEYSQASLPQV